MLKPILASLLASAGLLAHAFAQSPAALPDGLVSWWAGENDAIDLQTLNAGTFQNPVYATGQVGQAFQFSPTAGSYVTIPDSPSIHLQTLTVDAWVNFTSTPGSAHILAKALGGADADSFVVWMEGGTLHGYVAGANGDGPVLAYGWNPSLGVWHHVAYTLDGATHKLFVDGQEVASAPNTTVPVYDGHPLLIGADYSGSQIKYFFDGLIDEVDLFSRALTAAEVLSIYQAGSSGKAHSPSLLVSDAGHLFIKGGASSGAADFQVEVARPGNAAITVDYTTADGTAAQPGDYTAASGTLQIPAGAASATVHVPVFGAATAGARNFQLSLSNASGASLGRAVAQGSVQTVTGDATADFSVTSNGPENLWQYGYTGLNGTGFTAYTQHDVNINGGAIAGWEYQNQDAVVRNVTSNDQHYNSSTVQHPDELGLFPGTDGDRAVLRWRAPYTGNYQVTSSFRSMDTQGSEVSIVRNSDEAAPLLDAQVNPSTSASYAHELSFNAGETLDFRLGKGNDGYGYDGTGFKVAITPLAPPPPTQFSASGPTEAGGSIHFQAVSAPDRAVRVQYVTIANPVESDWVDLDDGDGGAMTEQAGSPGTYVLDTTAYPAGETISFRAISAKSGEDDVISGALGPLALHQAALSITAHLSSTSDPALGQVTRVGDDLTVKLTVVNSGDASAKALRVKCRLPVYLDAQGAPQQFHVADLKTTSFGGTFQAASTPTARDAYLYWDAGDLDGGNQALTVTFTLHIGTQVRLEQQIAAVRDQYSVASTATPPQPFRGSDGLLSNADLAATSMFGPISFTVQPPSGPVAPGALFTYRCTLRNLTAKAVSYPVVMLAVPDGARFATTYKSGSKSVPAVTVASPASATINVANSVHLFHVSGQTAAQIVIDLPSLAAHGDVKGRDAITFNVTLQAQWISPADLPSIRTIEYAAAFLDPAKYIDPATSKSTSEYLRFTAAFKGPGVAPGTIGTTDFYAFLSDLNHKLATSHNESGVVSIPFGGSLAGAPSLSVIKQIGSRAVDVEETDDDDTVVSAQPGDTLTFVLGVSNMGDSDAADVFLQDRMPDFTSFVSAKSILPTGSAKQSDLTVVKDADGHHLRFEGLQLKAHDVIGIEYVVKVGSGAGAPAAGTLLDPGAPSAGSTSTPSTPIGLYLAGPIEITGQVLFATPITRLLVPTPAVSQNTAQTAQALSTLYSGSPHALPLTDQTDVTALIPGVQRYYVHYENTGSIAARNVQLTFPLPAHTVFYRAAMVTLPRAASPTALPLLALQDKKTHRWSGGTVLHTPAADRIEAPAALSSGGQVVLNLAQLGAGAKGDLMIETIVTPDAIQSGGSLVGGNALGTVTIQDGTVGLLAFRQAEKAPVFNGEHANAGSVPLTGVAASQTSVPEVGIQKFQPQQVKPGEVFDFVIMVTNTGDIDADPTVTVKIPANTTYVSGDAGQSILLTPAGTGAGNPVGARLASNNGPIMPAETGTLKAHSAAALTIRLKAASTEGAQIIDSTAQVVVDYMGTRRAPATATTITARAPAASSARPSLLVTSGPVINHQVVNSQDVFMIDLKGGNVVALGGNSLVAAGGGNLIAAGGGNLVAAGGGNLVAAGGGNISSLLAAQSSLVAAGGGNIIAGGGNTLVAAGGGNLVAAGGGNLVAAGGGNLVAAGGGNLVAAGGGNLVAAGGGNLVAAGGGNIVVAGGANLVAAGGGNLLSSTGSSLAAVRTSAGNLVAAGGGNLVAAGGGN